MSNNNDLTERLGFAVSIAREAGRHTLRYFRSDSLRVELKSDDSPVTVADREAEMLLRDRITAAFPDDGILGEELGEKAGKSDCRWILDPIDGTRAFVYGVPLYGTLVAMERGGESVLGVIYVAALEECVYAAVGHGAWYQRGDESPRPTHVSNKTRLAESLFCASDVCGFVTTGRREVFDRLLAAVAVSRTWGDCYGYLLVATGRAELMVDPIMNLWDTAALKPILEEAGGTFTDFQGQATTQAGESIATNGHILAEVLRMTRTG
jgi:histidinol-phosphatase